MSTFQCVNAKFEDGNYEENGEASQQQQLLYDDFKEIAGVNCYRADCKLD